MRQILNILTRPPEELPSNLSPSAIEPSQDPSTEIVYQFVDLSQPHPNYEALLEAIFNADSIHVW